MQVARPLPTAHCPLPTHSLPAQCSPQWMTREASGKGPALAAAGGP